MPRGIPNAKAIPASTVLETATALAVPTDSLERVLEELKILLRARRTEFQSAADRISEILTSMEPKPRVGRPPKNK